MYRFLVLRWQPSEWKNKVGIILYENILPTLTKEEQVLVAVIACVNNPAHGLGQNCANQRAADNIAWIMYTQVNS